MKLSEKIQEFIQGVDPETYLNVLLVSLFLLLVATFGYQKAAGKAHDELERSNVSNWMLPVFILEWSSHICVIVAFASVVGFSYGKIPEAFVVSAPVAILVQRRALG